MSDAISSNLLRLRHHLDLTQEELAKAAGISPLAYRNIETGKSKPRPRTLQALAEALKVSVYDLVKPSAELRHVRFRSLKRLNTRPQILTQVADWLANFTELEDLLSARREYALGDVKVDARKGAGGRAVAAAAAAREALGLGPHEPVRDICGLLEANGVKVCPLDVASDAFFGLSVAEEGGGPAVAVNTWERISVERWIFTAAHELGHLVLHHNSFNVDETREEAKQEAEANAFASNFLMPEESFEEEWRDTYGLPLVDRVLKVKRMFRVSYKSVLYRVSEKAGNQVWGQFNMAYKYRTGRPLLKADEPQALGREAWHSPEKSRAGEPENLSPADFKEDRLWCLVRTAMEKELITHAHAARILGKNVDQVRQYMRTWV